MEWPYIGDGFYTLDLDLSYDSLNHKSDEGLKTFFMIVFIGVKLIFGQSF